MCSRATLIASEVLIFSIFLFSSAAAATGRTETLVWIWSSPRVATKNSHVVRQQDHFSYIAAHCCSEKGDGLCVPMILRCNKIIDCPNDRWKHIFSGHFILSVSSTDEENCDMVEFAPTYRTEFAPVEVSKVQPCIVSMMQSWSGGGRWTNS